MCYAVLSHSSSKMNFVNVKMEDSGIPLPCWETRPKA